MLTLIICLQELDNNWGATNRFSSTKGADVTSPSGNLQQDQLVVFGGLWQGAASLGCSFWQEPRPRTTRTAPVFDDLAHPAGALVRSYQHVGAFFSGAILRLARPHQWTTVCIVPEAQAATSSPNRLRSGGAFVSFAIITSACGGRSKNRRRKEFFAELLE